MWTYSGTNHLALCVVGARTLGSVMSFMDVAITAGVMKLTRAWSWPALTQELDERDDGRLNK